jgi:DNA-binding transcriptional LysR family regulator
MESLSGIVAFARTAEALSFTAAASALGVSASAVGKSVAKLEQSLGVRLFQRTTRRVALTEEGALFFERCRRILDDLHDAQAMLAHAAQSPRGRLRVGAPTIGYRFLLPILPEFRRLYPEVELDIDFNDRIVDVVKEELDAVIRSGELSDSSLMSRRLGPFRFMLCASPEYLRRRGVPRTPKDLESHDCLRFRFPTTGKLQNWSLNGADSANPFRLRPALTCNNMEALRAAAIGGLGIAYMPDFLARDDVASGRLSAMLGGWLVEPGQFSILWPSSRHLSPKLRAFVDFCSLHLFARE